MCSQDVPAAGELGLEESHNPWNTIDLKEPGINENTEEIEEEVEDGWPDAEGCLVSPWVEENQEPVIAPWHAEEGFIESPWVDREDGQKVHPAEKGAVFIVFRQAIYREEIVVFAKTIRVDLRTGGECIVVGVHILGIIVIPVHHLCLHVLGVDCIRVSGHGDSVLVNPIEESDWCLNWWNVWVTNTITDDVPIVTAVLALPESLYVEFFANDIVEILVAHI